MNIAIYLDHHADLESYMPLALRCVESARKHMPAARIIHLTTPDGPVVEWADERVCADENNAPFTYLRSAASAKVAGDTIFCDADVVFAADVSNVFEMNFDVAVSKSIRPAHPWLACGGGAVFSRNPKFYTELARFGRHLGWSKAELGSWVPSQLLFNWLLTMGSAKVHFLPADIYEYKPKDEDDPCTGARILHFKGRARKTWDDNSAPAHMRKPTLITPAYKALLKQMHAEQPFGVMGQQWAPLVEKIASQIVTTSILDYGSGPGSLSKALPELPIKEYDPCIEGKDAEPEAADLVVCTDMLEHVEPECVEAVLDHLRALTARMAILIIFIGPAEKTLPDGRNAHLIQESPAWWIDRINRRWGIVRVEIGGSHLVIFANGDKGPE